MSNEFEKNNIEVPIPQFKSTIPSILLENVSDSDRYIMESISILNSKTDWQTTKIAEQAAILKKVEVQTTKTNGRVTELEKKNIDFNVRLHSNQEVIDTAKKFLKLLSNKYILIAILAGFVIFWHLIAIVPVGNIFKLLVTVFAGS